MSTFFIVQSTGIRSGRSHLSMPLAAALLGPYLSGGVSDGDKGDVVVSGGGAVWSLDYPAVNAVIAPAWANITGKPAVASPILSWAI